VEPSDRFRGAAAMRDALMRGLLARRMHRATET
jgi:hypothetical protein